MSSLQEQILEPLLWLLKKNHPDDPLVFARLVSVLTELRNCEDIRDKDIMEIVSKLAAEGRVHLPDIVREIYTL